MHKVAAETIAAQLAEVRSCPDSDGSQVAGGPALSTTLKVLSVPLGSDWLSITPRNFVGAGVTRFALNPYLTILRTTDSLTLYGNFNDHSVELQDGDTTDVAMDAQGTAAAGDFIYVGATVPFRGVAVTVGTDPQNTASVLTVNYWNGAWTAISETDGTETGGNTTFAQTGNVTWTVPATWTLASLQHIGDVTASAAAFRDNWTIKSSLIVPLYWTRWEFSATTEATWNVSQMKSLNRSTAYAELLEGQTFEQSIQSEGPGGFACVEALTDAGTANVVINAAVGRGESFN
mgnify:CR=1 FL=1